MCSFFILWCCPISNSAWLVLQPQASLKFYGNGIFSSQHCQFSVPGTPFEKERNLFWQKNNDITNTCNTQCTATCVLQPSLWLQSRGFQSVLSGSSKYTMEIIKLEDSQSHTDFLPLITQQGSALCSTPAPGAAAHNICLCASIPLLWISDSANIYWAQARVKWETTNCWSEKCRAELSIVLGSSPWNWCPGENKAAFPLHPTSSCYIWAFRHSRLQMSHSRNFFTSYP